MSSPEDRAKAYISNVKKITPAKRVAVEAEFVTPRLLINLFVTPELNATDRAAILSEKVELFFIAKLTEIINSSENPQLDAKELAEKLPCFAFLNERHFAIHEDLIEEFASVKELKLVELKGALEDSETLISQFQSVDSATLSRKTRVYIQEAIKIHFKKNDQSFTERDLLELETKYIFRKDPNSTFHLTQTFLDGDEIVAPFEKTLEGISPKLDYLKSLGWVILNDLARGSDIHKNTASNHLNYLKKEAKAKGVDLSEHIEKAAIPPLNLQSTLISPLIATDFEIDGHKFEGITSRLEKAKRNKEETSDLTVKDNQKGDIPSREKS